MLPLLARLVTAWVLLVAACQTSPSPPRPADDTSAFSQADAAQNPAPYTPRYLDPAPVFPTVLAEAGTTQTGTPAHTDSVDLSILVATLAELRAEVQDLNERLATPAEQRGLLGRLLPADSSAATPDTANATERVRQAAEGARQFGLQFAAAVALLLLTLLVIRGIVGLLETLAERSAARRLFFKKLIPVVRLLTWSLVIYIVLTGIFGLDRTSLLAAATALGVAIGFAAQDVLKNIFGGIIIIFDQPFQVGDKISVGGTYGEVVSIGLRSTRIVTPDDNLVSVPNSQVVEGQVANANAGALDCQVVVDLYLPGWTDVRRAKAIAYEAAANSRYVYLEKPIVVIVKDVFKETFLVHLKVKAYVLDTRYEFIFASDVTEAAKSEFLRTGLLYPMGDVHPGFEPSHSEEVPPSTYPEAPA